MFREVYELDIVYGYIELLLPYCTSLKEKRKIIQSIIARIRKRYNISISEVKYQNLWQRTVIGFTAVSSDKVTVDKITMYVENTLYLFVADIDVKEFQYEIVYCDV